MIQPKKGTFFHRNCVRCIFHYGIRLFGMKKPQNIAWGFGMSEGSD